LSEITKQSIFNKCELIILDANSPDNEYEIAIKEYMLKFSNIIYRRLEDRLTVQATMNLGIDISSGEFLTLANVDDTRTANALEKLAQLLSVDPQIDLVYADSLETTKPNETFDSNNSSGRLYEHSLMDFSLHNMIKCLPGPMPMWRKRLNTVHGVFDINYKYAGDWEMWLRASHGGSKFKKLHKVLGLYYNNPKGLSTDLSVRTERFKEERSLFHTYKDMFGDKNSQKYSEYFK
jgi:glycosyltransferase involved in cell wall biosynthesis